MFDIGFFEICLIAIIALIVIGPEKLPRVARTTGLWIGKARGAVKTVKYEIDEQLRVEELKQSMNQASDALKKNVSEPMTDIEESFENLQNGDQDTTRPTAKSTKPKPTTK
ncbi:MAG: preprotein translocase subunit TatB [Cycloclasticus sp. symbiont of Poecilosclerida sp. M]|nr:MAG: preprotein translocase subunit TatB [Cycloclasticus sp. symbiont of Poecilosclerida sp. M]